MNILDIIIIISILFSVVYSLISGIVKEIFSLLAIILGVFISIKSYNAVASPIDKLIHRPNLSKILGFIICFVIISLVVSLIGKMVRKLIRTADMAWMDRLIGAGFGVIKGVLIWSTTLIFLITFSPSGTTFLKESKTLPYLLPLSRIISNFTSEKLKGNFDEKLSQYSGNLVDKYPIGFISGYRDDPNIIER